METSTNLIVVICQSWFQYEKRLCRSKSKHYNNS